MTPDSLQNVLRIGIIQKGKILEERVFRDLAPVTIGTSSKNTFSLFTDTLPSRFPLFEFREGAYSLLLPEWMQNHFSLDGVKRPLPSLLLQGRATQSGLIEEPSSSLPPKKHVPVFRIPLSLSSHGSLLFGDYTLLFRSVSPPAPPALLLPSRFAGLDRAYFSILLLSALAHVCFLASLRAVSLPLPDLSKRPAFFFLRPPEPPTPSPLNLAHPPTPSPPPSSFSYLISSRCGGSSSGRSLRIDRPTLAVLGELLHHVQSSDLKALRHDRRDQKRPTNTLRGATLTEIASLQTPHHGCSSRPLQPFSFLKIRHSLKSSVTINSLHSEDPHFDPFSFRSLFRQKRTQIKSCYERFLKTRPSLRGRLTLRFTIALDGRLSKAEIQKNKLHPGVARCIIRHARRWRFPSPQGSPVKVSIPFLFFPPE